MKKKPLKSITKPKRTFLMWRQEELLNLKMTKNNT